METVSALLALMSGIHWSSVDSPHNGQWRGTLKLSLICAWINGWANNWYIGDLKRHSAHYDVIVAIYILWLSLNWGYHLPCIHQPTFSSWSTTKSRRSILDYVVSAINYIHGTNALHAFLESPCVLVPTVFTDTSKDKQCSAVAIMWDTK